MGVYPASDLATVTRLNTYTTTPPEWTIDELHAARSVDVVAAASPSALRVWATRVGTVATVVAIGPTSANEARRLGFNEVLEPIGSKGIQAWADLIVHTALKNARSN